MHGPNVEVRGRQQFPSSTVAFVDRALATVLSPNVHMVNIEAPQSANHQAELRLMPRALALCDRSRVLALKHGTRSVCDPHVALGCLPDADVVAVRAKHQTHVRRILRAP